VNGAAQIADHDAGDLERRLLLAQGRAEIQLRAALFLGRFHSDRERRRHRRVWPQELEGRRPSRAARDPKRAAEAEEPTFVDIICICQPLHETRAPVNERSAASRIAVLAVSVVNLAAVDLPPVVSRPQSWSAE